MRIKIEDIIINGMTFSPVDAKQDLEDIKQGSTLTTDIDVVVLDLFKKYIEHIWNGDTENMYATDFIHSESQTYDIEKDLNACCNFDLMEESELEKFKEISKKLAHQLISIMRSTTRPGVGILFILNIKINNSNYLCILKVEVAKKDIRIWFDEDDLKITYNLVENVLPPDPKKLQKGAIYPHPSLEKDLKILQDDYKSNYFDQFLQCRRGSTEFKQFKALPEILNTIHEELAPDVEIDIEQAIDSAFTELGPGELLTTQKTIDLAKKVAPEASDETVQETVYRELEREGISDMNVRRDACTRYKGKITIDDITIKGPAKSIEDKVVIKKENGVHCVVIEGNTEPKKTISKK